MPGTKVLVRDLKQSTTMRSGKMDEDLVVFADDERNFEILGGRVDKLKEKFEKTMRMKAASRFADDGFSLGMFVKHQSFNLSTTRRGSGSKRRGK